MLTGQRFCSYLCSPAARLSLGCVPRYGVIFTSVYGTFRLSYLLCLAFIVFSFGNFRLATVCGQGGRCDPRATQRPIACPPRSLLHSFCETGSHSSDLVSFLRWLGCVYSWEFLMLIFSLAFSRGDAAASILPGVVGRKRSQHSWGKHTFNLPVFGGGPCPPWSLGTLSRGHCLPSLQRVYFQALQGVGRGISSAERRGYLNSHSAPPGPPLRHRHSPQFLDFWGTLLLGSQHPRCLLEVLISCQVIFTHCSASQISDLIAVVYSSIFLICMS